MNIGIIGEAKVLTYFIEKGYKVFTPFDLHSPFDLVIYRDNILQRVSVKTTSRQKERTNSWEIGVGQTCKSSTNGKTHKVFDPLSCDLVAIYIVPESRIVVFSASQIKPNMKTYVPLMKSTRAIKRIPLFDSVV
jgi:hypothetical protein